MKNYTFTEREINNLTSAISAEVNHSSTSSASFACFVSIILVLSLNKYDNFTNYGQALIALSIPISLLLGVIHRVMSKEKRKLRKSILEIVKSETTTLN